jgi:hypothetical protein
MKLLEGLNEELLKKKKKKRWIRDEESGGYGGFCGGYGG